MPLEVLVCDNERHIVRLIEVNLKRQGYSVTCAYGGRQAIELMRKRRFDLVVLDPAMPDISGDEVRRWMSQNEETRFTKVVVLGGKAQDQDAFSSDLVLGWPSKTGEAKKYRVVDFAGASDLKTKADSGTLEILSDGVRLFTAVERRFEFGEISAVELRQVKVGTTVLVRVAQEDLSFMVPRVNIRGYFVVVNRGATRRLYRELLDVWTEGPGRRL